MADKYILLTGILSEEDVDSSKNAVRVIPGHLNTDL